MKKIERCYNCGKVLSKGQWTKEHIPAKNLFDGYDLNYKTDRITVPACFECNNKYSSTDEEFRNLIGVISNRSENDVITNKAVRSIMRKDPIFSRLRMDVLGNVAGVSFKSDNIVDFHKKNFRGLFYHQYGYPLPEYYELFVNINEEDYSKSTMSVIQYLKSNFKWKISGHKDILTYCIHPLRDIKANENKEDFPLNEEDTLIVGALIYNNVHGALVYAIRKDFWNKMRTNKM